MPHATPIGPHSSIVQAAGLVDHVGTIQNAWLLDDVALSNMKRWRSSDSEAETASSCSFPVEELNPFTTGQDEGIIVGGGGRGFAGGYHEEPGRPKGNLIV